MCLEMASGCHRCALPFNSRIGIGPVVIGLAFRKGMREQSRPAKLQVKGTNHRFEFIGSFKRFSLGNWANINQRTIIGRLATCLMFVDFWFWF